MLLKLSMHNRKDTSSRRLGYKARPSPSPPTQIGKWTWLSDTTAQLYYTVFCSALLACVSEETVCEPHSLQHGDLVYGATYGLVLQCGVPTPPLVPMAN